MSFFTNSGKLIEMANADLNSFCAEDIAHGLSLLCRAAGQFKYFYSVAQHSLNCMGEAMARGLSKRVCFACLLHDASEAYLFDVPTPLKDMPESYKIIEADFQDKIYEKFGIYPLSAKEKRMVDVVDKAMLWYEFKNLHTIPIHFEKTPNLCSRPNVGRTEPEIVEKTILREINAFINIMKTTA